MASLNKVLLIGNLGRDPEVKYLPNGDAVANVTIATTESWKDKAGEKVEKTEWHRVTFYKRLAEIAGQYLKKGSQIYVEGRIETRKWTDKEGKDRYSTEIIASEMKMLGSRGASEPAAELKPAAASGANPNAGVMDLDSDVPFDNPYRGRRAYVV